MTGTLRGALVLGMMAALNACRPAADESASAAEAVRAADIAWAQAFARKDIEGYLSFVEATASIQQPNGPTVTGTAAIRALIEGFYALPNLTGTWQPIGVVVARSGELGYSTGTYELSYNDPSGKPVTERGKYVEIWRRQVDRGWKMVVESFNSDQPPAGAAPN